MKIVSRYSISLLVGLIFSMILVSTGSAQEQPQSNSKLSLEGERLKQFLQAWDNDKTKTTRYVAAFRDLDADGVPEAIVYLISDEWCGSGGCSTLILKQDDSSWRVVTRTTVTRPPIRVLTNIVNGWRSIGVWVRGGGIQSGYEAELNFNGKNYPSNPTRLSARQSKEESTGEVVIQSTKDGVSLYELTGD